MIALDAPVMHGQILYTIVPSPGGTGLGMVALCDIKRSMPFVSEQPSLRLARCSVFGNNTKAEPLRHAALQALHEDGRRLFEGLIGVTDQEKLARNCCGLSRGDVGIFFSFAKVNHSCRPNAVNLVDDDVMTLVALSDIKAGEEVTISYLMAKDGHPDILLDRDGRRASIRNMSSIYGVPGIDCLCKLCTSSDMEVSQSDARRKQTSEPRERFLGADGTFDDYIAMEQLMAAEELSAVTVGQDVVYKCTILLGGDGDFSGSLDSNFDLNFPVGSRVALFKLIARPELNGRTGTVVEALNKQTRRIGVCLDVDRGDISAPPLALKLSNIMLLPG